MKAHSATARAHQRASASQQGAIQSKSYGPQHGFRWWVGGIACLAAVVTYGLLALSDGNASERKRRPTASAAPTSALVSMSGFEVHRSNMLVESPRPAPSAPTTPPPVLEPEPERIGALRAVMPRGETARLLFDAEESFVSDCMKRRGFEYTPATSERSSGPEGDLPRFDPRDISSASANGYGLAEALELGELPQTEDANAARLKRMPPEAQAAWNAALFGNDEANPTDGTVVPASQIARLQIPGKGALQWDRSSCFAEARRALFGSDVEHEELEVSMASLMSDATRSASQSPAVIAGRINWRACMANRGFRVDDTDSAVESLMDQYQRKGWTREELRAREVEMALADATCHAEAGLDRALGAAVAVAEDTVAASNPKIVTAYAELMGRAIGLAEKLATP